MQEIGYDYWGLIPFDETPTQGKLNVRNPPMMSIVALEQGFSLVFKLKETPPSLTIQVEATALSSEGHGEDVLRLYCGTADDAYKAVPDRVWEKGYESLYALFQTTLDRPGPFIKMHYGHSTSFVINRVQFYKE